MSEKRIEIVLPEPCKGESVTWIRDGNDLIPMSIGVHETIFHILIDHINELHEQFEKLEEWAAVSWMGSFTRSKPDIGVGETVEKPKEKE